MGSERSLEPAFAIEDLESCGTLSRGACRSSTKGLTDTWAMRLTRKMQFRMHFVRLQALGSIQGHRDKHCSALSLSAVNRNASRYRLFIS
jgi:hypothetical protein